MDEFTHARFGHHINVIVVIFNFRYEQLPHINLLYNLSSPLLYIPSCWLIDLLKQLWQCEELEKKDDMKWRNCVSVSQGKIICNNLIIHDSCYMLCVAKGRIVLATNSFAMWASNLNLATMFKSHIKRYEHMKRTRVRLKTTTMLQTATSSHTQWEQSCPEIFVDLDILLSSKVHGIVQ